MAYPYPGVRRLLDMPKAWEDRPCLISAAGRLSFAEVRERVLLIAGWLGAAGVRAGDCVAICLPKSLESALLIYGIHATGAAYVPLAHGAPALRLGESLRTIRPRLLVLSPEAAAQFDAAGEQDSTPSEMVDATPRGDGLERLVAGIAPAREIPARDARDLAAVMLTSGSTGTPKGVMRGHDSVPLRSWLAPGEIRPEERFISTSALNYTSSHDIFFPVAGGCSVYLVSEREAMFPDRVSEILAHERTTSWVTTATALRLLLETGGLEGHDLGALQRVRIAGEPLRPDLLRQVVEAIPQARFTNIYGATEAATMLHYEVPRPFPETMKAVPLGRPSGNFEVRLCDDAGEPVGDGEVGEICAVGGPMMLGYWNDPALTRSRQLPGLERSYRTGDFARRGADGLFYSAGRADDMVKIRGHRFDLGEVEAALRAHSRVREAVAFALTGGDGKTAIHAAVLVGSVNPPEAELLRLCAERLPSFARPACIALLADFPLLSTGKVDRATLRALLAKSAVKD
jgi:amino acid adenylation domain-containing protein